MKYLDVTCREYKNRNLENGVFFPSFFLERIPIIFSPVQSIYRIFGKWIYYYECFFFFKKKLIRGKFEIFWCTEYKN